MNFKEEEIFEERSSMKQNPVWMDVLEEEEFDNKIQNLPSFEKVNQLAEKLIASITVCLRKG